MNETINVHSEGPLILPFLPLIIFTIPFLILVAFLAKRKGVNLILAVFVGLFPMANILFALWLASKTDLDILKRLKQIEDTKS